MLTCANKSTKCCFPFRLLLRNRFTNIYDRSCVRCTKTIVYSISLNVAGTATTHKLWLVATITFSVCSIAIVVRRTKLRWRHHGTLSSRKPYWNHERCAPAASEKRMKLASTVWISIRKFYTRPGIHKRILLPLQRPTTYSYFNLDKF